MINNDVRSSLKLVCEALNKNSVEYLIIGGVAVGYYGHYRISSMAPGMAEIQHDIDFWYNPSTSNFYKLLKSLEEIEVDVKSLDNTVFDKKQFLRLTKENFKMEFLPEMIGVDTFQQCKSRCEEIILDGNTLYILGYDDLIRNKKALGRKVDKSDIQVLEGLNKKNKK